MSNPTRSHLGSVKACAYLRRSTGLQAYSIEFQAQYLAAYAANNGYQIIQTFSDNASGLTLKKRPGLQALLASALGPSPGYTAILIYDVSRWGRFQDLDQGAHYEFLCRKAGLAVEYCVEPFDNDGSPEANLIKQIKRSMAAEYSRALSSRIASAKRNVAAQGFLQCALPPYGLRRAIADRQGKVLKIAERGESKASNQHKVILVPGPEEEVEVVRQIFQHFVEDGLSFSAIARTLLLEGRFGGPSRQWNGGLVKRILIQEAYIGTNVYGKTIRYLSGPTTKVPPSDWVRKENAFEPILDRTLFDAAQARMSQQALPVKQRMLDDLRKLLERKKRLDTGLIDETTSMLSSASYIKHFGSLRCAYGLVGYDPVKARHLDRQKRIARSRKAYSLTAG